MQTLQFSDLPSIHALELDFITGGEGWGSWVGKYAGTTIGGGLGAAAGFVGGGAVAGPPGAAVGAAAVGSLGGAAGYDAGKSFGNWVTGGR